MPATNAVPLDLAELGRLLRAADPAALLVPPRLLRRVIKRDRKLTGWGLQVPHRKSYVVGRDALLALADRDELGVEPDRELPPQLILIAAPEPEQLAAMPRGPALVKYWRLLFHGRVHQAIEELTAAGRLDDAAVRERIHHIGRTEFDEVCTVLRQEKYLLPPRDDRTAYEEFAAVYLELRFFDPTLLADYFPAIEDFEPIDRVLLADVDACALFAATRLDGAPDPVPPVDVPDRAEEPGLRPAGDTPPPVGGGGQGRILTALADRAAAAGNTVRAALLFARAAHLAPTASKPQFHSRAAVALNRLVERLSRALHLEKAEAEAWRQALSPLLPRAAEGVWPAEARLLYDLQKVCVDHERPIYAPDVVEWVYSGFRRPLVRPLPNQPLVLAVKHLRGAAGRLPAARLTEAQRHALSVLLRGVLHHAETRLRDCFRPIIDEALCGVGLQPQNFPERVSRDKLIEELLDRVTERGFLNMGDLRDALSRNQLKLPDLSGPGEFFAGDPLLRANRRLAVGAAGVYRRGEVYLRWLQRLSALAFGTRFGRLLSLNLFLPFGGAFLAIEGPYQIVHEVEKLFHFLQRLLFGAPKPTGHHAPFPLAPWPAILLGGVFFWLLLHVPAVRRATVQGLSLAGRVLRTVLIDVPAAVLGWPVLRRFLESRPVVLFAHVVIKPLPLAALAWVVLIDTGLDTDEAAVGGGLAFVAAALFLNSRLGRDVSELAADWAVRRWEYLRDFLPGLVRLVADVFKRFMEAVDRLLYSVDEWLRFRGGESRLTLVAKTVGGVLWSGVTYVVRFILILFVEPQVNPIKHFPVVTISHKLLLPMIPALTQVLIQSFSLRPVAAGTLATIIIGKIPGVFGFLVWELKENWRLYRANRPRTLRPVMVGHHGETLARLLRPGFHSGTLPKLYAKLRRAERKARRSDRWRTARRLRETLHHVEESIRHFAERELLAYLNGSRGWTAGPVHLAAVESGSNCIRLTLACPALSEDSLELKFEERAGWLVAGVTRPSWLDRATPGQAAVLALALTGYYKLGSVDLVREQIEAAFAPRCPPYDLDDNGLVVWPGPGYEVEAVYDLGAGPVLRPRVVAGPSTELPVLDARQILFRDRDVAWQDWVDTWERDQDGKGLPQPLMPGMRLLPPIANVH